MGFPELRVRLIGSDEIALILTPALILMALGPLRRSNSKVKEEGSCVGGGYGMGKWQRRRGQKWILDAEIRYRAAMRAVKDFGPAVRGRQGSV